jgi:hypothetical protein
MSNGANMPNQKPVCVVIDTCIWRSEYLLKTPKGQSLVYTLGRKGGHIGFPEVVERELTAQIVAAGMEEVEKLEDAARKINYLTDSLSLSTLPTELDLEKKVEERIAELKQILVPVPFTLEHAKAALDMVNAKVAPNGHNNQQFKDSAIWQAVLTLSQDYTTYLLTRDSWFLLDRDPEKGLATNLREDCRRVNGSVEVYVDLALCLEALSDDAPSFDEARLTSLILESLAREPLVLPIQVEAMRKGSKLGEILTSPEIYVFRTKQADRIAVDYTITMQLEVDQSAIENGGIDGRAILRGSCYYDQAANSLDGHFIEWITFRWNYPSGGFQHMIRSFENTDPSIPYPRPVIPWHDSDNLSRSDQRERRRATSKGTSRKSG